MSVQTAVLNIMADAAAASIGLASLHSADPGSTGTSELAGGSPAYARNVVAWDAGVNGVVSLTGEETFNVPAGATVAWVGLWASNGTTFRGKGQLTSSETYGGQGSYVLEDVTITVIND